MKVKYENLDEVVFCKCGCGKELTLQQKKWGGIYATRKCANRMKGLKEKGIKKGKYQGFADGAYGRQLRYQKNGVSYQGKSVCLNYDDTNINCVICYEQGLYRAKSCRIKGE